jgi:hypothetical protein
VKHNGCVDRSNESQGKSVYFKFIGNLFKNKKNVPRDAQNSDTDIYVGTHRGAEPRVLFVLCIAAPAS